MSNDDYPVGYCKPPEEGRFRPGRSGNPRGRIKGTKNKNTYFKEVFNERFTITENGKPLKVTAFEIILRRLREKAFKGDMRAIDAVFKYCNEFGPKSKEDTEEKQTSGVLLVEAPMSIEMWELAAEKMRQQQMRDNPERFDPSKRK